MNHASFELGRTVITRACRNLIEKQNLSPDQFLARHHAGDFGNLDEHDREMNKAAIVNGSRIMSVYPTERGDIWIITEADRSSTTLLLPSDY
ncbi:hypothetical protein N9Y42_01765 [Mariniblastus sp.]|nr:hypothetical protein [Mariniblastus sp.]